MNCFGCIRGTEMATKSEELIGKIQLEVTRIQTLVEGLQNQIEQANLTEARTSIAVVGAAVADLKKWRDEFDRRGERLAVLDSQFAELKKQFEENDRRRWQFWLGVGVVVITFVANLTINLLMFFAKKPA